MSGKKAVLLQGNEACVKGALTAGLRFFAGYPITPSSEIAEQASIELPKVGGCFMQMEDEIASMGCALGASLTGVKSMTATSGPGFSLKQELIGFGAMAEIPVVIVSIMRMGPSTGLPTSPAAGDIMQAKWGTHGDHPAICICPTSVKEMHDLTVAAFNYAEKYRTPVMLMTDEVIAHMREGVVFEDHYEVIDRVHPAPYEEGYLPYACEEGSLVPPMAAYGEGYRFHVTGLSHDESGFPTNSPAVNDRLIRRLCAKVEADADNIVIYHEYMTGDCGTLFVAYGSVARTSLYIVKQLRAQGIKAGLFIPKTIWPFPEKAYQKIIAGGRVKNVIVPEMNMGQLVLEVDRLTKTQASVVGIPKVSGELFKTEELYEKVMAVI